VYTFTKLHDKRIPNTPYAIHKQQLEMGIKIAFMFAIDLNSVNYFRQKFELGYWGHLWRFESDSYFQNAVPGMPKSVILGSIFEGSQDNVKIFLRYS